MLHSHLTQQSYISCRLKRRHIHTWCFVALNNQENCWERVRRDPIPSLSMSVESKITWPGDYLAFFLVKKDQFCTQNSAKCNVLIWSHLTRKTCCKRPVYLPPLRTPPPPAKEHGTRQPDRKWHHTPPAPPPTPWTDRRFWKHYLPCWR